MYCEKCGKKINPEDKFCGSCGTAINSLQESKENVFEAKDVELNKVKEGLGMKWYKFLIYFALFFTVFSYIVNCVSLFTGAHYDALVTAIYGPGSGGSEMIYKTYPAIKIVDRVYGVSLIVLAVVTLIIRSRLANFKTNGSNQYIIFLLIMVVINTAYSVCVAIIIKSADITLVTSTVALVARFFLEKLYFSKREHLFVN